MRIIELQALRPNQIGQYKMKSEDTEKSMLGVNIGCVPLDELVTQAVRTIDDVHGQITFACANPHSLVEAQHDMDFIDALNRADQVVADGVGIIVGSRLGGFDISPRITGDDYFQAIMNAVNLAEGKRVFFMGSTTHVLERIVKKAAVEYPNIEVGTYSPPFGQWTAEQENDVIAAVNAFNPDVLWVGMTAPKQEKWVDANRDRLNAHVIGSIGAVFDFYAETHPRAPEWMNNLGLEWLHRLVREPRRMWRRNFVSTPKFLALVMREKLRGSKDATASI